MYSSLSDGEKIQLEPFNWSLEDKLQVKLEEIFGFDNPNGDFLMFI